MLLVSRDELFSAIGQAVSNAGRNKGDINMTPEARVISGALANLTTLEKTSTAMGISPHHSHELKHGKHSNAQGVNEDLRAGIDKTLDRVENKLASVLENTIDLIKTDDVESVSVVKKTQIAANLSSVLARISSRRSDSIEKGPTVVLYAPESRPVDNYKVIEVVDNS